MDLFDRIYELHKILNTSRYPVPRTRLQETLGCSRATVNRALRDLKDLLQAPVVYNRQAGGYYYAQDEKGPYQLPGLWFNASEICSLTAIQHLLTDLQPGLLESHLAPFRARLEQFIKTRRLGLGDLRRRIRLLGMAIRPPEPARFQTVTEALLRRRRLTITYHSRSRDMTTHRTISPQRLIHYRDNWYLDSWDHGKQALRSFAVERIKEARLIHKPAKEIKDKILDEYFATSYGIFAGKPKHLAVLKFTPERSRWVAEEVWHPKQKHRFEGGCCILEVPYSDSRELVMDILKHGPEVTVLGPAELKAAVVKCLEQACRNARKNGQ